MIDDNDAYLNKKDNISQLTPKIKKIYMIKLI